MSVPLPAGKGNLRWQEQLQSEQEMERVIKRTELALKRRVDAFEELALAHVKEAVQSLQSRSQSSAPHQS